MSIERKAFEAYEKNRELAPKYQIGDSMWMDWYTKGYRQAENEYKDQVESLKAALVAKEETHKIKTGELKEKALNAFLECEGYDEFECEINS